MVYLAAVLTIALTVAVIGWSWRNWNKKNKRGVVLVNLVLLALVLVTCWYTFPIFSSWFLYRALWLNVFYIVPVLLGGMVIYYLAYLGSRRNGLAVSLVYGLLGLIIIVGGVWFLPSMERWQAARFYRPERLNEEIATLPSSIRFTPFEVAYQFMKSSMNSTRHAVEEDLMDPVAVDGTFGYVSPVTPNGAIQTFMAKMDGFVVYNDDPSKSEADRIRRVTQRYVVGENMEWQDDIVRVLYRADSFCKYTNVYYLQLDPTNPEKFTAVAPKIKYRYRAPIFWVPVWGGVSLVHDDGRVEELSPKEAMADPRLRGKMIFPEELALYMVEVQIFDRGLMGGFYRREGKIDIPELPGDNQMPFLVVGRDGFPYAMVSTEPAGPSTALFRQYYIDLSTGSIKYYEYDATRGAIGPRAAIDHVKSSIAGRKWVETDDESGTSGDFRVIEPRPLVVRGSLHWLLTVTSREYTGITSTAVVEAKTKHVEDFATRADFVAWLGATPTKPMLEAPEATSLEKVEALLQEALRQLSELKKK